MADDRGTGAPPDNSRPRRSAAARSFRHHVQRFSWIPETESVQFFALQGMVSREWRKKALGSRWETTLSLDWKMSAWWTYSLLYTDGVYDGSDKRVRQALEEVMREHYQQPAKDIYNALLGHALKEAIVCKNWRTRSHRRDSFYYQTELSGITCRPSWNYDEDTTRRSPSHGITETPVRQKPMQEGLETRLERKGSNCGSTLAKTMALERSRRPSRANRPLYHFRPVPA